MKPVRLIFSHCARLRIGLVLFHAGPQQLANLRHIDSYTRTIKTERIGIMCSIPNLTNVPQPTLKKEMSRKFCLGDEPQEASEVAQHKSWLQRIGNILIIFTPSGLTNLPFVTVKGSKDSVRRSNINPREVALEHISHSLCTQMVNNHTTCSSIYYILF